MSPSLANGTTTGDGGLKANRYLEGLKVLCGDSGG